MGIPRSSAPTIVDVAELAGVSRATASRAMGNYGRISDNTAAVVRAAALQLGYRPNEIARAMRAGKTKTIGLVIVADFTNAFFDRATKAIVDSAKARGYQVLITNTDEDIEAESQAVQVLLEKQVDGLIVVPSTSSAHNHLMPLQLAGKPVVLIDRSLTHINVTSVTTDDFSGTIAAVRHAFALGHSRFGFLIAAAGIVGRQEERPALLLSSVEERIEGFLKGSSDCGIKPKQQTWIFTEDEPRHAEASVAALLDAPKGPTVIFTSNNDMALAVLKVAGNRQLIIGRDISLVTIDDSLWLSAMNPGITVVARPVEELGLIAVEKLIAEMADPNLAKEKIVLPTELVARGSVANLVMYPELDPESQR